ncbi:MAG: efflux RND transporter permease subunit [Pseudomonadota bacterium]
MTGIVDWAASRARMVIAFIALSLTAGALAYVGLPKEGEPDIDIPGLFVAVPFSGISAEDSEDQLVRPMETEFQDLDGLVSINSTAAEGFAGIFLEFEFGWDKSATIADVRDAMNAAQAEFPIGAEQYTIDEINFSEFPIIIVALSGSAPERTLLALARDIQDRLEGLPPILEAGLAGDREELLEVVIDPLALEAYGVTANDLISAVVNNNQLIAADEVRSDTSAFAVRIPSSFDTTQDVYDLPVSVNGDRVVTLGDLADIRLTFEDREGTARFNGETTVALQVIKRQGFNVIDTVALVREEIAAIQETWPEGLQASVTMEATLDLSVQVEDMVSQLESSVLTAVALVMIVVLAALGTRSALLVGFAIPTSFLLCFILLGLMGIAISNIVMFGLILAVGMLVDGAIVVVEYADKRLKQGARPMQAYTDAAKRMFWPIVSSTATTLCAFLPMLFWPGVPGEFMGMLPVTLIFVLSASLIVALIYLPVMGGVAARASRLIETGSAALRALLPVWPLRLLLAIGAGALMAFAAVMVILGGGSGAGFAGMLPGAVLFVLASVFMSITIGSLQSGSRRKSVRGGYRRSPFGHFIHALVGNPVMPVVSIVVVVGIVGAVFSWFGRDNNGVEFFVTTEPENALVYVLARGNMSIDEQDALVRQVEEEVLQVRGVRDAFAFAGNGGLNNNTGGAAAPGDTIGQIQFDFLAWDERPTETVWRPILGGLLSWPTQVTAPEWTGNSILQEIEERIADIPGIRTEVFELAQGPASGKPVVMQLRGDNWEELQEASAIVRQHYENLPGLVLIEDTLPLPGIDWELPVDVEQAGRYNASVATVGAMVQLVTRGILLDTMRVPSSDDEIEIRVRFPEDQRNLSTLETLRVRTDEGLVPLTNFVSWQPAPQLAQIDRLDRARLLEVKADTVTDVTIYSLTPLGDDGEPIEDAEAVQLGFGAPVTQAEVDEGAEWSLRIVTPPTGLALLFNAEPTITYHHLPDADPSLDFAEISAQIADGEVSLTALPLTPTERIERITEWLQSEQPLPASVEWSWGGDQEEQQESQEFLSSAFAAALGLMFIILLAQFNSFYNALLVLLAVVLSTTGVLVGMLVMDQTFSIIMTGTGIVALAGIVVNNNIVLIDTYQEYSRYMPRLEAIVRTAEARIRPVLLTTITTMAGLAPMMFGISLNFAEGGYTIDAPTALWWKQLATAVVFGLGVATVLTLIFTPSLLALRVWFWTILGAIARGLARLGARRMSRTAQDWSLQGQARRAANPTIFWDERPAEPEPVPPAPAPESDVPLDEGVAMEEIEEQVVPAPEPEEVAADSDTDSRPHPDGPPLKAAE